MWAALQLRSAAPSLLVLGVTSVVFAHGGTYYGPGNNPSTGYPMGPASPTGPTTAGGPSGTGVPTGSGPSTGAPGAADPTSWGTWWGLHRASYLELRRALLRAPVATRDEDAFLGFSGATSNQARASQESIRGRVVPALLAALERERNPDVLSGALLALAKSTDANSDAEGRVAAALRAHLGQTNQEVGESAAIGLGILGAPSAATTLVALLRDDAAARKELGVASIPTRTRAFAGYGLGLLGLRHSNPDIKRFCAQALCTAYEGDVGRGADVRVAAILALGLLPVEPDQLGPPAELGASVPTASRSAEIDWLVRAFAEPRQDEAVRAQIPVSLARHAHGSAPANQDLVHRPLLELLGARTEASAALQQSAATALGLLGDNDEDPFDRRIAEVLRQSTHQGDRYARKLAYIALARVGSREGTVGGRDIGLKNARLFLADELHGDDGQSRPWAALALGVLEHARIRLGETASSETAASLRAALAKHDAPLEAGAYCIALGLCKDASAREAIQPYALRTVDDELQASACLALGMIGATESLAALREVARASRHRPIVLRDACIALGLLGDHELVPVLVGWLRDAPNVGQLSATATALGWVGDQRAIDPLCEMLGSEQVPDRARAFAAVALGLICEKDLLPWNAVYSRDLVWWLAPPTLFDPITGTGILDLL
ncbi:MAG: HEAT repeat domain-containing protein [Planctomycetes bacterium]|nr:HEAT repeat domain-containing protein [Planctomycetota bacterium]